MEYFAYIESLKDYGYFQNIRNGLDFIQFQKLIPKEAKVFIKPNLTFPVYRPGVMTSPEAVEAALLAFKEFTPNIYIGDSDSGGYNRFSMDKVYQETGLQKFADKYGIEVVNLSRVERKAISFKYRGETISLQLPKLLTDEIDLLVTMPVPKVHANTGVSLSFKNQWGCIPENDDRLRLHPYLPGVLVEVNRAVKAKVMIMDGRFGLNINGPMKGEPVELNWLLITNDIGAGAALACELIQMPLRKINHLKYADDLGYIPKLDQITINQDFRPFIRDKFVLRRAWTDLPGYLAFHNSILAYIAYFSPISDLLHRFLYLFREPFYDYDEYSRDYRK